MRLRVFVVVAVIALAYYAIEHRTGGFSAPDPSSFMSYIHNPVPRYRFTLATAPAPPVSDEPITVKVHVVDADNHDSDGLIVEADFSATGLDPVAKNIDLHRTGRGNYEGKVQLGTPGDWDVDVMATKDGKSSRQRISLAVGAPRPTVESSNSNDDE